MFLVLNPGNKMPKKNQPNKKDKKPPNSVSDKKEYWDDPSDDEDFENLDDSIQSIVANIRKAITLNISLDETDILYDFDILEIRKKFELLKFLNVDGLLCRTTRPQLKQKLVDWFNEEKDIKVKIRIPFKFRPKRQPKSVENYSKQLCKKFDSKFYDEIYDEKNSEFHDNLHYILEDIYIHTFHDDSNIDGYLTIKIYVNRNDQSSEYIPRLKNIVQWVIDQANSSKVFTGTFECDLENCIVLFRTSSGVREYEKLN